jgi:hypothetical protein
MVEVVILVSGVSMMLGLCAVILQLLMQLNADGQSRLLGAVSLERLSRQLRDDVHACRKAELARDPKAPDRSPGLRLELGQDHSIVYEVGAGHVVRDESRAGKRIRHESFGLERGRLARFEERDEAAHKLVALVVTRTAGKSRTDPPRTLEVVALPGKHRLASPGQKGDSLR